MEGAILDSNENNVCYLGGLITKKNKTNESKMNIAFNTHLQDYASPYI